MRPIELRQATIADAETITQIVNGAYRPKYYEKYGYTRHRGAVTFLQKGEKVQSNFEFMHRGGLSADAAVELLGLPW